jgi:hypothetical protein
MISIKLSHRETWLTLILLIILLSACSRPAPIQHIEKKVKTAQSVNGEFQAIIEKSDIQQGKVIFPSVYRIYIVKKGEEQQHFYVVAYGWKKLPTLTWTSQNNLNISYFSGTIVHFNDSFYQQSGRINLRFVPEQNTTSELNEEKILPNLHYDVSFSDQIKGKIEDMMGDMLHAVITKNKELLRSPSPDKKHDAVLVHSDSGGAGERYLLYIVPHRSNRFPDPNMIAYQFYDKLPTIIWKDSSNVEIHYTDGTIYDFQDSVWEIKQANQIRKVRLHLFYDNLKPSG